MGQVTHTGGTPRPAEGANLWWLLTSLLCGFLLKPKGTGAWQGAQSVSTTSWGITVYRSKRMNSLRELSYDPTLEQLENKMSGG